MKPLNLLLLGITLTILLVIVFTILKICSNPINYLDLGNLIILGVTLIVIMIYAYDTNRLANLQQKIYLTPNVVHQIEAEELIDRTLIIGFDLINFSSFYVSAFTYVQLKCFENELGIPNDVYYGKTPWNIPPNSKVHGHFKVDDVMLKPFNSSLKEIRSANENSKALTLTVKINCKSIYGIELSIPETKYFYSFERKTWVSII